MNKVVFILSVSSDIGFYLAKKYIKLGYTVLGTYRVFHPFLYKFPGYLFRLDIDDEDSLKYFVNEYKKFGLKWDIFISCVGEPRPLTSFFESDFDTWERSVNTNSIRQLEVLHSMYPYMNKKGTVVFFAAGGINNAVVDFSAYTIGKIILIKMCEYLDAENKNLKIFIVGPG